MNSKDHPRLSIFLCIALVITILPLIGAVEPASAASGYFHGTVRNAQNGVALDNIKIHVKQNCGNPPIEKVYYTGSGSWGDGYWNSGTLGDASDCGFTITANHGGANSNYDTQVKNLKIRDAAVADFNLNPRGGSSGSSTVTFSGSIVADVGSAPLSGIEVYLWRHDGRFWTTTTGSDGKWSKTVDKSSSTSNPDHRINVIANPSGDGHTPNPAWFNSSEQVNLLADRDKTLTTFRLLSGSVTFKGKVMANGKPVPGITAYLWRHDNQKWEAVTNANGEWVRQDVPRSVWVGPAPSPDHRINLAINKAGIGTYNQYYNTPPDKNDIPTLNDYTAPTAYLESRLVTISGRVTDARHSNGIPGITVFFYRQDKKEQVFATTNVSGYYSKQVERSSDPTRKYNLAANKPGLDGHPVNASYAYDPAKDINNIQPSGDRTNQNFRLEPNFVIFKGKVTDRKTNQGIPGIWVYFWRQDGNSPADPYAQTLSDGTFSMVIGKSCATDKSGKYNVAANKNNPGHPQNPQYAYDATRSDYNKNDISACSDYSGMNFYLESYSVTFSGKVTDSKSGQGIKGIQVNLQGSNGKRPWTTTGDGGTFSFQVDRSYDNTVKYIPRANNDSIGKPINPGYTVATLSYRQPYMDQPNINFVLTPVTTPVPPTPTVTPIPNPTPPVTPTPTPSPDHTRFAVVAAEMVSPEELGVAVKATYPAWIGQNTARTVTIQATINGKYVAKTIPVTQFTTPGSEWDDTTMSGSFRVKPTTPIRINLREAGVPRFTDDVSFAVSGTASYAGGVPSRSSSTTAEVRLPVLAYHGYNYPNGLRATVAGFTLPDEISWWVAYKGFSDYLTGNWKYNRDTDWGLTWKVPLELKGYTDDRYMTLWDAEDSHLTYTNPLHTAPPQLRDDVQAAVDRAKGHSYADKVNLVGHSFGGLLSRYYASERPQYVNKVVTVGSPMQGVTFAYQTIFTEEASSRTDVERTLTVQEGPYQGQKCAVYWGFPTYPAVNVLAPTVTPTGVPTPPDNTMSVMASATTPVPGNTNLLFQSTYSAPIRSGVDYHFIYATNHMDTPHQVWVQRNRVGQWYHVESVTRTAGDGTVISRSGGDIGGASGTNVHRHAVTPTEDHAKILNSRVVQDTIIGALLEIPEGTW